jgi:hypothetical protein
MSEKLNNLDGRTLTPEKKGLLVDEVNKELKSINESLKKGGNNAGKQTSIVSFKDLLQEELNVLFDKKGVITPEETNRTLNAIRESKKARLQSDFFSGLKTYSTVIGVFIAVGIGIYIYTKNKSK